MIAVPLRVAEAICDRSGVCISGVLPVSLGSFCARACWGDAQKSTRLATRVVFNAVAMGFVVDAFFSKRGVASVACAYAGIRGRFGAWAMKRIPVRWDDARVRVARDK